MISLVSTPQETYQIIYSLIIILSGLTLFVPIVIDFQRRGINTPTFVSLLGGIGILLSFSKWGILFRISLFILLVDCAPVDAIIIAFLFSIFCLFLFLKSTFDFRYSKG